MGKEKWQLIGRKCGKVGEEEWHIRGGKMGAKERKREGKRDEKWRVFLCGMHKIIIHKTLLMYHYALQYFTFCMCELKRAV